MTGKAENKTELTKAEQICAEKKRIAKLLKSADKKALSVADGVIENAAFMTITLRELMVAISLNGVVQEYNNGGGQSGIKRSAEVEVYNSMVKNYASMVGVLLSMLPKPERAEASDGFDKFVMSK